MDAAEIVVGHVQVNRSRVAVKGDQYVFIALASTAKAILTYRIGKRTPATTEAFVDDLSERILGAPEISTDGYHPYLPTIRNAFGSRASHGVITKTYSVTHLAVKGSWHRADFRRQRASNRNQLQVAAVRASAPVACARSFARLHWHTNNEKLNVREWR